MVLDFGWFLSVSFSSIIATVAVLSGISIVASKSGKKQKFSDQSLNNL
jgi:hypothetical protein